MGHLPCATSTWYCGYCGHGPHNSVIDRHCTLCNIRDCYARIEPVTLQQSASWHSPQASHFHEPLSELQSSADWQGAVSGEFPPSPPSFETEDGSLETCSQSTELSRGSSRSSKDFSSTFNHYKLDLSQLKSESKASLLEAYLFSADNPWGQDLHVYAARTQYPGQATFSATTLQPATTPQRRVPDAIRRAEYALTRGRGACPNCRRRKQQCRHRLEEPEVSVDNPEPININGHGGDTEHNHGDGTILGHLESNLAQWDENGGVAAPRTHHLRQANPDAGIGRQRAGIPRTSNSRSQQSPADERSATMTPVGGEEQRMAELPISVPRRDSRPRIVQLRGDENRGSRAGIQGNTAIDGSSSLTMYQDWEALESVQTIFGSPSVLLNHASGHMSFDWGHSTSYHDRRHPETHSSEGPPPPAWQTQHEQVAQNVSTFLGDVPFSSDPMALGQHGMYVPSGGTYRQETMLPVFQNSGEYSHWDEYSIFPLGPALSNAPNMLHPHGGNLANFELHGPPQTDVYNELTHGDDLSDDQTIVHLRQVSSSPSSSFGQTSEPYDTPGMTSQSTFTPGSVYTTESRYRKKSPDL